jgi:hypothetical protein
MSTPKSRFAGSLAATWKRFFGPRRKPGCRWSPVVEALEDRALLSTINAVVAKDEAADTDGLRNLREAIIQADNDPSIDTIRLGSGTYVLDHGGPGDDGGLTGDLDITRTAPLVIEGQLKAGDIGTTIDGTALQDRIFHIPGAGAEVVFRDLIITGGLARDNRARGGAGGRGGDGGAGQGGGLWVGGRGPRSDRPAARSTASPCGTPSSASRSGSTGGCKTAVRGEEFFAPVR